MNIAGLSAFDADMGLALRDVRFGWPPKLLILCQKAKLCDEGHIAFAQSSLDCKLREGGCNAPSTPHSYRRVLLTATVVDVVAAVKTVAARRHFYYATPVGINVAVPNGMKSFPTELLPQ
ncbi:MAG: hypothetical protein WCF50_03820 [Pseudolabrys sp.]